MNAITDEHHRLFAEWFGLRPSTARPCPTVAAGKRCREYTDIDCICERHPHHLLDHARVWLNDRGEHVYTCEPYNISSRQLAAFLQDLHEYGLKATLSGRSPWNPGATFLILVEGL